MYMMIIFPEGNLNESVIIDEFLEFQERLFEECNVKTILIYEKVLPASHMICV